MWSKVDTAAALRNSPLHITSLFLDNVISKEEEEIGHHEDKQYSSGFQRKSDWYHPYNPSAKNASDTTRRPGPPAWKQLSDRGRANEVGAKPPTIHSDQPRVTVLINDNYCVPQLGCVEMAKRTETFVDNCQTLNCFAINHVHFVAGQPQKKVLC